MKILCRQGGYHLELGEHRNDPKHASFFDFTIVFVKHASICVQSVVRTALCGLYLRKLSHAQETGIPSWDPSCTVTCHAAAVPPDRATAEAEACGSTRQASEGVN